MRVERVSGCVCVGRLGVFACVCVRAHPLDNCRMQWVIVWQQCMCFDHATQGKSFGAKLLTCVQQSLHAAGVRAAVMPALVTTEGESLLAAITSPTAATAVTPGGQFGSQAGQAGIAGSKAASVLSGPWPLAWAAHSWPRRVSPCIAADHIPPYFHRRHSCMCVFTHKPVGLPLVLC